ncbi:hypothetical protein U8527_05355 [Kordia algicida OT-1]|uniref:Lipocalin-like domain-containing protein n=1 Tax=Kordia algicida OT-1 TaxID=391587 RepID=A9DMN5_9FLAO|nr:hypothetical protein [Kordia algicida]EDP97751.1 hypothetical protein KAOT1_21352 [Kordia algicida OT-1]
MKKHILVFYLLLFFSVLSCLNVREDLILGKCKIIEATSNNEEFKKAVNSYEGNIYIFKPNGKFIYNDATVKYHFKDGIEGTWTLKDNEINVVHTLDLGSPHTAITDKNHFFITKIIDDKMTLEMHFDNGNVFTLHAFRRE